MPSFSITRPRALVGRNGHRDDPAQPETSEAVLERGVRPLGGVAESPRFEREPPAHLDRRGERRVEGHALETDEADETSPKGEVRAGGVPGRGPGNLDGPQAEAVVVPVLADARGLRVALGAREHRREMLHDARVSVERRVRCEVFVAPAPEDQPARADGALTILHGSSSTSRARAARARLRAGGAPPSARRAT